MKCSYEGNFNIPHSKKRRVMGSEKDKALAAIIDGNICPSVYTRNEANRIMKEGNNTIFLYIYYFIQIIEVKFLEGLIFNIFNYLAK